MLFRSLFVEQDRVQNAIATAAELLDRLPMAAALTTIQREKLEACYQQLCTAAPSALPEAACYIDVLCGTILLRLRLPGQQIVDKVTPFDYSPHEHYYRAQRWLESCPLKPDHDPDDRKDRTRPLRELRAWLVARYAKEYAAEARASKSSILRGLSASLAETQLQVLLQLCETDPKTVSRAWFGDTGRRAYLPAKSAILDELARLNLLANQYSRALHWFAQCHEHCNGLTKDQHEKMLVCVERLKDQQRQIETDTEQTTLEEQVQALGGTVQGWYHGYIAVICGFAFTTCQLRDLIAYCRDHHIGFGDLCPGQLRQHSRQED